MSLAKTKKKKRRKKLFSSARPKIRKNYFALYSDKQIDNLTRLLNHDQTLFINHLETSLIIGFDEVGRGCIAGPVCTGAYSCSNFYQKNQNLIKEVKRSMQLVSGDFMSLNDKDVYYSETLVNDYSLDDELQSVQELSSLLLLDDSKKVAKNKRKTLCESLLDIPCFDAEHHLLYSTNFQTAHYIDENGIVKAIWQSMTENLIEIVLQYLDFYHSYPKEILLLIDGTKIIQNLAELSKEELNKRKITDFSFIERGFNKNQSCLDLQSNKGEIIIRQHNIVKGDSKSALIAAASNLAKDKRDDYMKELALSQPGYLWENNVGYGTRKHMEAILDKGLTTEHRKTFLSNIS